MLLFTGCRRGEILTLKWNEVGLDEDCASLWNTKSGRPRMVHLNAWVQEVVEGLHDIREKEVRTAASGDRGNVGLYCQPTAFIFY